jgi:drug/metabolite transporter (DMT)-like permease
MHRTLEHVITLARVPANRLSNVTIARISLTTGAVIAGSATTATKSAIAEISPLTLAFCRFGVATLVLLVICRIAGKRPDFSRGTLALGLVGVTIAIAVQNVGLQFTSAATATLIIEGSVPIATVAIGFWCLKERVAGKRLAGLGVTIVGVIMSCLIGTGGYQEFSLAGCLFTLLAGISFGAYSIIGRHQFREGVSFPVITGSVTLGTVFLAPLALGEMMVSGPGHFTPGNGLTLIYLGVAGSAAVHCLWSVGLRHLESIEVAALGTVMPVAGIAFAMVFLDESLSLGQVLCGLLIILGLSFSIQKQETHAVSQSTLAPTGTMHFPNHNLISAQPAEI